MQQPSRRFLFSLPIALLGFVCTLLLLSLSTAAVSRADTSVGVTVGVGATSLTIDGQTSPDTFVTVLQDSTPIGSTSADGNGLFSLSLTLDSGGIYKLSLFGRTPDGAITDPLNASINAIEHQNTIYAAFLPPTIALSSSETHIGSTLQAYGETIPGGTVTLTNDTGAAVQVHADISGKWSAVIAAQAAGVHNVFAVASDSFGQQSGATRRVSYIVTGGGDVQLPPAPISFFHPVPTPTPSVPLITNPQDSQYVASHTVTIKGIAENGSLIELWDNGSIIGSAYASSSGSWQIPFTLTASHSILRARSCHFGECSDFSPPVNIYFSAGTLAGSLFSTLDLQSYSLTAVVGQQLSLPLVVKGGTTPYLVSISWGDKLASDNSYALPGRYVLLHSYASPGLYNGAVTIEDGTKAKNILHFAVRINARPLSSRLSSIAILGGVLIVAPLILRFVSPTLASKLWHKR